jgi:hypothetical protein
MSHAITQGDGLLWPDDPVPPAELFGSVRSILRAGTALEPSVDSGFWARATSTLVRRFAWRAGLFSLHASASR